MARMFGNAGGLAYGLTLLPNPAKTLKGSAEALLVGLFYVKRLAARLHSQP